MDFSYPDFCKQKTVLSKFYPDLYLEKKISRLLNPDNQTWTDLLYRLRRSLQTGRPNKGRRQQDLQASRAGHRWRLSIHAFIEKEKIRRRYRGEKGQRQDGQHHRVERLGHCEAGLVPAGGKHG